MNIFKKFYKYINIKKDKNHKLDKPTNISYYENGSIKEEWYFENGKLHRLDSPAWISYYENGNIKDEHYCVNYKYHRLDGPARISYYEDGSIKKEIYYINGEIIDEFKYHVYVGSLK